LISELKLKSDVSSRFDLKSPSQTQTETGPPNEVELLSDIASLSSKQDCARRDIDRLLTEVETLRQRTESLQEELLNERADSQRKHNDLETLKVAVSKLSPPWTIHIRVPGLYPLSEGIISHLTNVCGGNVCDRQRVHAFSDSVGDDKYCPRNAADFAAHSLFHSVDRPNQCFGYDFKGNQLISPTHYAIRSRSDYGAGWNHPKSWVIEVTNDRTNEDSWIEIDRRENNQDLNGRGVAQVFACSKSPGGEFRYIRMRQIGVNHYGNNTLVFEAFEVFGQLRVINSVSI
jgi:hypothetical protein